MRFFSKKSPRTYSFWLLPFSRLSVTLFGKPSCDMLSGGEPYLEGGCMTVYQIRLKERLDQRWSNWLGGLRLIYGANGETVLTGEVVDQAALHGLLSKVRDLHLTLISVSPLEADSPFKEETKERPGVVKQDSI